MPAKQISTPGKWLLVAALPVLLVFSGCSPTSRSVRCKINSEPEGSHVVYKVEGKNSPCGGEWIYLGDTPLRGIRQFDEDQIESAEKIILKVFRSGYHDQVMEWDGRQFWDEVEGKGVIFWTPELIQGNPD